MSKAQMGKVIPEETRRKLSAYNLRPDVRVRKSILWGEQARKPRQHTKGEKILYKICDDEKIEFKREHCIELIDKRYHSSTLDDIFIKPNICLYVHDDVTHSNPNRFRVSRNSWRNGYKPNDLWEISTRDGILVKEIWQEDELTKSDLEAQNYIVHILWEYELIYETEKCRQKIIDVVRKSLE